MAEELDPLEMLEPVNILDRLAKDFFEKIVSASWKLLDGLYRASFAGVEAMEGSQGGAG